MRFSQTKTSFENIVSKFSSGTEFKLTVQQKECVGNDSCSTSKLIDAPFFEESTTEFSLPRSMYYNSSSLPVPSPHNSTTRDPYNMTTILPYNHSASVCAALDEDFGYNYYKLSKAPEEACLRVTVLSRSQSSIGVMYGDCSSLSCIAQRQFGSENGDPSLKFLKESGKEYIVAVGSYSRQGGPYIVNIEVSFAAACDTRMYRKLIASFVADFGRLPDNPRKLIL